MHTKRVQGATACADSVFRSFFLPIDGGLSLGLLAFTPQFGVEVRVGRHKFIGLNNQISGLSVFASDTLL